MNRTYLIFCIIFILVAFAIYMLCKPECGDSKLTTCKEYKYIENCSEKMMHVMKYDPENMKKEVIRDSNPLIIIYDDFLSEEEVDFLINAYNPKTKPSTVVDKNEGYVTNLEARKSFSHYTNKSENEVIQAIEKRASEISGFPNSFIEPIQFLKYEENGYFRPHHDYFAEDYTNGEYQRYATIFVYLNDDFNGGTTLFPKLDIEVKPKRGRGLLWFNVKENGDVNPLTLHTGTDVKDGEKYGLNIWIRNKKFS